jgi:HPt (histidine-containing phosphotransfer) domain-containing protein
MHVRQACGSTLASGKVRRMNDSVQFDQSVYQVLCDELGEQDAIEVLQVFLADASSRFRTFAAKFENRAEIMRDAHSIKSSSATLGFMGLACLARELEAGASSLAPAEMQELVSKMTQAFERSVRFAEINLLKQALLPSPLRG